METRQLLAAVFVVFVLAALITLNPAFIFAMVAAGSLTGYAYGPALAGSDSEV